MTLTDLSIPSIDLPIEIAVHLHPYIVHFAIVIPVIVLLLEVYNIAARRPSISLFSLFLLILLTLTMFSAYLTGDVDAKATFSLLSEIAQGKLELHKQTGILLVYASAIVLILKIILMPFKQNGAIGTFVFVLSLFVLGILYQGKTGDVLVYKHGANIAKVRKLTDSTSQLKAVETQVGAQLKTITNENTTLKTINIDLNKSLIETKTLKERAEQALLKIQKEVNQSIEMASEKAKGILLHATESNESILKKAKEKSILIEQEAQMLLDNANKTVEQLFSKAKEDNKTITQKAKLFLDNAKKQAEMILNQAQENNQSMSKSVLEKIALLEKEASTIIQRAQEENASILHEAQAKKLLLEKEGHTLLTNAKKQAMLMIEEAQKATEMIVEAKKLIANAKPEESIQEESNETQSKE